MPGPATLAWFRTTVARFVQRVSWPPSVPLPGSVQAGPRFAAAPGRRSHSGSQARNSANVCGYSTSSALLLVAPVGDAGGTGHLGGQSFDVGLGAIDEANGDSEVAAVSIDHEWFAGGNPDALSRQLY